MEPWARGAWSPGIRPVLGWGGGVRPGWKREQKCGRGAQQEVRGGVRIETWVAEMGMNAEAQWGRSWESVEGTGGATVVTGMSALVLGVRGIMRCCRGQSGWGATIMLGGHCDENVSRGTVRGMGRGEVRGHGG